MTARKPSKTARKFANRTPIAIIQNRILAYVREHDSCKLADIIGALGLTRSTANKHAVLLCADDLMHFTLGEPRNGGREYIYHAGPKPEADEPQGGGISGDRENVGSDASRRSLDAATRVFRGARMSLDISLIVNRPVEVYDANITHNLNKMAEAAGIYKHLWRPDEIGVTKAVELIEPLTAGLAKLKADPAHFEQLNSPNGWGLYKNFGPFVEEYLAACVANPDAEVSVSR